MTAKTFQNPKINDTNFVRNDPSKMNESQRRFLTPDFLKSPEEFDALKRALVFFLTAVPTKKKMIGRTGDTEITDEIKYLIEQILKRMG